MFFWSFQSFNSFFPPLERAISASGIWNQPAEVLLVLLFTTYQKVGLIGSRKHGDREHTYYWQLL